MFWITGIGIPLLALVSNGILLLITARQAVRKAVSRFFIAYLVSLLVWSLGAAMMYLDRQHVTLWNRVMLAGLVVMPVCFFGFTRAFLKLREKSLWQRLGYASSVVLLVLDALGFLADDVGFTRDGLVRYEFGPAVPLFAVHYLFFLGFAAVSLIQELRRRDDPLERNRIRYAVMGMGVIVLGCFSNLSPALGAHPLDIAANVANALLLAYAIFRYQLLDVSVVIRKGLLYSIPTAFIAVSYFLVVFVVEKLLRNFVNYQVLLLSLLVAAITAIAVEPLRNRTQGWIDRLFFREKYDAGEMLQRLSRTVASVLDVRDLTVMILEEINATMHVAKAAIFLKQEGSGEFRLVAHRGHNSNIQGRMRTDHPLVEWLSDRSHSLTRAEVDSTPQFRSLWAEERQDLDEVEAQLFAPLLVRDELIGILILGPKLSEAPFSADEQLVLDTLANQTAVAVENARLFSHEQRKARESSALLEIARAVSSVLDLNRLLEIIAQKTAEVCEVDRCTILLLDEERNRLVPLMSQFSDGAKDQGLWQLFRAQTYVETIDQIPTVRRVIKERQPVILNGDTISLVPRGWTEPFNIASLLAVPLVSKDAVIGLMALDHSAKDQPFTDEQANLATTIGSHVAIAIENARLYEEIVEEKDRTETILQQAFAGIMVVDMEMRVVVLNPEAESIIGRTAREVVGKRLSEICGPDLWGEESLLYRAMITGEPAAPAEATLVGKGGARDVLLGVTPLQDGYLLSFADITHLKEVDRLKSDIVASVSHELRAPLASIMAYTELLLGNLEDEDRALRHRFLSIIDQEAKRLAELINDVLDLSRLEEGRFEPQMKPLSISDVIDDVITLLEVQARERDITFHRHLAAHLPIILADKGLMTTLIKNLLSNAIKFSHDEGQIDVVAREEEGFLILDVVDRGMGIAPEDLPHLFERFYRSPAAREAGISGTGLGLVLAKAAAEVHGGMIQMESELDKGTRFTVFLPVNGSDGPSGSSEEHGGHPLAPSSLVPVPSTAASALDHSGYV